MRIPARHRLVQTVVKPKEDSLEEMTVDVPVLLPHNILSYLQQIGVEVGDQQLAEYWSHVKAFCPRANDPAVDGTHIPLTLYGESVRYGQGFDQSKIIGCFMSCVLWRPKSTRMSQWLSWNLNGEFSLGWRSHYPLYLALVKSLNAAFVRQMVVRWFANVALRSIRVTGSTIGKRGV